MKENTLIDLDFNEYLKIKRLSNSSLKDFAKSPYHFRYWQNYYRKPTQAMEFGSLIHSVVLEPLRFADYAVMPKFDLRRKEDKEAKKLYEEQNEGKKLITEDEANTADSILEALATDAEIQKILKKEGNQNEKTLLWEYDDVECKSRFDIINTQENFICDLKTTIDATQGGFTRQAIALKYHWQAAFYMLACESANIEIDRFYIIALEKKPPFYRRLYEFDDWLLSEAKDDIIRLFGEFNMCIDLDGFFDNPPAIITGD